MPLDDDRTPAQEFLELWQAGRPDVADFLGAQPALPIDDIVAVLRIDQRQRWSAGERIPAEAYLDRFPALRVDVVAAVDMIYSEFLLREATGEAPTDEEYGRRFPEHAQTLKEQFALHRLARLTMVSAHADDSSSDLAAAMDETLIAHDGPPDAVHLRKEAVVRRPRKSISNAVGAIAASVIGLSAIAAGIVGVFSGGAFFSASQPTGQNSPATTTEISPVEGDRLAPVDLLTDEWLPMRSAGALVGWSKGDGYLESDGKVVINNLKLKSVKSPRYRIECEFSAKNAHDAIYFMLPVGQRQCFFGVNAFPDGAADTSLIGFGEIDGQGIDGNATGVRSRKLVQGERHRLSIEVSLAGDQASLEANLDDLPPISWTGAVDRLAVPYTYRWPERQTFGVGTVQASYRVHSLIYRELPNRRERAAVHKKFPLSDPRSERGASRSRSENVQTAREHWKGPELL